MSDRLLASEIKSSLAPGKVRAFENFTAKDYRSLEKLGISIDPRNKGNVRAMMDGLMSVMDAVQPTVTTGSISTPEQFLQFWLPGLVAVITAARKIDDLIGLNTVGDWADEEVIQAVIERTGTSLPYGDYANTAYADWNLAFERRTIVRFEEGIRVGRLEESRAAKVRVDSGEWRRKAAALALEIIRNSVGFNGYNSGNNRTYGFLNDPNLPNYVNVPNGAAGTPTWATKTFQEIQKDILTSIVAIRNNSLDNIDPENVNITLAIATAAVDRLAVTTDFGMSVRDWLTKTYPRVRVVSAPELNAANGGANVFYTYANEFKDVSTDDGMTWGQNVPQKFYVLGVKQETKGYEESYSNATAGSMCKRPYAVVRYSGI